VCNVIRPGVGYCLLLSVFQYDTQITTFPCCNLFCWGGGEGENGKRIDSIVTGNIPGERVLRVPGIEARFFSILF